MWSYVSALERVPVPARGAGPRLVWVENGVVVEDEPDAVDLGVRS